MEESNQLSYLDQRNKLKNRIEAVRYGNMSVSDSERKANDIFLSKVNSISLPEEARFNFKKYKEQIMQSDVYSIIKQIPKGSLHHQHLIAGTDPVRAQQIVFSDEVVKYVYINPKTITLIITSSFDKEANPGFIQLASSEEYKEYKNSKRDTLLKYFYLLEEEREDRKEVFTIFAKKILNLVQVFFSSKEFFKECLLYIFKSAIDQGINNFQSRSFLPLNIKKSFTSNETLSIEEELDIILSCVKEVQEKYDKHFTFHLIAQTLRFNSNDKIKDSLNTFLKYKKLKKEYSNLIIGFDLVAEELTRNSIDFSHMLYEAKIKEKDLDIKFFLHAGESINEFNDNIYDNLLLNTPRIGHGTILYRKSYLLEEIKRKEICVECNPLSNQLLRYFPDLKAHPLRTLFNYGIKVSINSDDHGIFETDLICLDVASAVLMMDFNLLDLKRLFLNSIECSCIDSDSLISLTKEWQIRWDQFINSLLNK